MTATTPVSTVQEVKSPSMERKPTPSPDQGAISRDNSQEIHQSSSAEGFFSSEIVESNFEEHVDNLEGYLYLKSAKRKWIKRYYVLKDGKLASYNSNPNSGESRGFLSRQLSQDINIVKLDDVEAILPSNEDDVSFHIKIKSQKEMTTLKCTTSGDVALWVSGLYHAINNLNRDRKRQERQEAGRSQPMVYILFPLPPFSFLLSLLLTPFSFLLSILPFSFLLYILPFSFLLSLLPSPFLLLSLIPSPFLLPPSPSLFLPFF